MPPIELTDAEKAKFDAFLKEMGFENGKPSELINRLNSESQTNRERAEKAEKDLKSLGEQVSSLVKERDESSAAKKKAEEEAAAIKRREEESKMTLDQRIESLKAEISSQFEGASKQQAAELKALTKKLEESDKKLAQRDHQVTVSTVKNAAIARGIIDADLVEHFDFAKVKRLDNGEIDMASVTELIETHAKEKPVFYKDAATIARENRGRQMTEVLNTTLRPAAAGTDATGNGKDWGSLSDAEFAAEEAKLRVARA